jgi:hypothetical protein
MTPIFKKIWRDRQRKEKRRRFKDQCGLISAMDACDGNLLAFDCTEIRVACFQMADEGALDRDGPMNMPAQGVWLEGLERAEYGQSALFVMNGCRPLTMMMAVTSGCAMNVLELDCKTAKMAAALAESAIRLINTPTVVNKVHVSDSRQMAHRGCASSAWMTKPHTVVRLCIDGKVYDAKAAREASGGRPWHLVRGHYRRYHTTSGTVTRYVVPHFRGDKALGELTREYECYSHV